LINSSQELRQKSFFDLDSDTKLSYLEFFKEMEKLWGQLEILLHKKKEIINGDPEKE